MPLSLLQKRINTIKEVFDTDSLLKRDSSNTHEIARYYRLNRLAYHFFNSSRGFVHMGISLGGHFKPEDFLGQANIIQDYITKAKAYNVLELGAGKAATTRYLARQHPGVHFIGMDLPNGQLNTNKELPNLELKHGDYHDLSGFKDSSLDVVYAIEALCHARDKAVAAKEVARILRPGGYFVVFDGYSSKLVFEMNDLERLTSELVYKSMMVGGSEQAYSSFRQVVQRSKLSIIYEQNLSNEIMPSVRRLEAAAIKLFRRPWFAKAISKTLPKEVPSNAIAAYLMPLTIESGLHQYWLSVCQKSAR